MQKLIALRSSALNSLLFQTRLQSVICKRWEPQCDVPAAMWQVAVIPDANNARLMGQSPKMEKKTHALHNLLNFAASKPVQAVKQAATVDVTVMDATQGDAPQASQQTWLLSCSASNPGRVPETHTSSFPRGAVAICVSVNGSPTIQPSSGLHSPLPMCDVLLSNHHMSDESGVDGMTAAPGTAALRSSTPQAIAGPGPGSLAAQSFLISGTFICSHFGSLPHLVDGTRTLQAPAKAAGATLAEAIAWSRAQYNKKILEAVVEAWQSALQWLLSRFMGPKELLYRLMPNLLAAQAEGNTDAVYCFKLVSSYLFGIFYKSELVLKPFVAVPNIMFSQCFPSGSGISTGFHITPDA